MYTPVAMEEKGIKGTAAGLIVSMQAVFALISSPIWTIIAKTTGTELIILLGTIFSGVSLLLLGLSLHYCDGTVLILLALSANMILGASSSAMFIGEQHLLLRYSTRTERE